MGVDSLQMTATAKYVHLYIRRELRKDPITILHITISLKMQPMDRTEYIDHLTERGRELSEITSTVCRNIGFAAGIACWAFRDNNFTFPSLILLALACLCLFFLLDITQYAMAWHVSRQVFNFAIEKPPFPPDAMLAIRRRLSRSLDSLFLTKLAVLFAVYILIGLEVIRRTNGFK